MPIYAFECGGCGHSFDRLQKLSDPDPTVCPECSEARLRRQLTAPQFRLAGGGWYETDFKQDGDKKRNLADKGEPAKAESKVDAPKSDSKGEVPKPESKAESKPAAASPAPSAAGSG